MVLATVTLYAQPKMPRPFTFAFDLSKYEKVDSLPIERVYVHTGKEDLNVEDAINLNDGDYMFKTPFGDRWLVIRTNADRTAAIVTSHILGMRLMEYNIEENDRRIVLWHKDNRRYCGIIYDKQYKVCQQFNDAKRNFDRFLRPRR